VVAHILARLCKLHELMMPSMMGNVFAVAHILARLCESHELVMPSMMGVMYLRSQYFWMG